MESPPRPDPTLPEAEIAPGVPGVPVTATAMPKGPRQQPPEPEWIGDGESTSPTGEADRQGANGREKGRRECAYFRSGSRGVRRTRGATAHACNGARGWRMERS